MITAAKKRRRAEAVPGGYVELMRRAVKDGVLGCHCRVMVRCKSCEPCLLYADVLRHLRAHDRRERGKETT